MSSSIDINTVIARLSPSVFEAEFDERRRAWLGPLEAQGWRAQVLAHRVDQEPALGNHSALPPVLSVGELRLEAEWLERSQHCLGREWIAGYLQQHSYPALVSWSKATTVSFRSLGPDDTTALLLAQKVLVSVVSSLRADLVRVVAIDTVGFGRRAAILRAAVPRLDLVTTQEDVRAKLMGIQSTLRDNLDALGLRDETLGDFNHRNVEGARPFTFVFIASTGSDLKQDNLDLVKRIAYDDIGVRGGVQFVLAGIGPPNEREAELLTQNSPRVLVMGPTSAGNRRRLEVVDVSGLDTREGGAHEPFEVVATLDVDELEFVADNCRRHLDAGRPPKVAIPLPPLAMRWTADSSSGISVPLGRNGSRVIHLTLGGGGLTFNALIGGAVGTGKTVLLHGIVCQGAANYSPDELQLSLLDYKEGTEFAIYRSLPHLYALSLGPSSDFGLEVIRSLQREMSRRASLYKGAGVRDLADYRHATGEKLARHLVIIDEFQVLLANRTDARDVLEDLIRRGRSAGIHIVLASQSLADMSLNTAVLGQLGARICLKLAPSECARFLAPGNESPSRFQHPGEALFNDREGASDANVEFRAASYDLADIRMLVADLAARLPLRTTALAPPFVYEADEPLRATADERRLLVDEGHVMWGLSQELPPRAVATSLVEAQTLALIGRGEKLKLLLAALRDDARRSGLALHECAARDLATTSVPATGPVLVSMTETSFAIENCLQSIRDRLPFSLIVVASDARMLTAPWLRTDVICCGEGDISEILYRKLPALQHEALVARVQGGGEPSVLRLYTTH